MNISVFGSAARGERDEMSDLDVIAIVRDGGGKQSELPVLDAVRGYRQDEPSISWYGEKKIRTFFQTGDLFAWHLFLESIPVEGYPTIGEQFGRPNEFRDGFETIRELARIYEGIPLAIDDAPQNIKYELGICYVCFRNIAMAASWHLCEQPDFGRYSPYSLGVLEFPLSRMTYDLLWRCRISGQRGFPPPTTDEIDVRSMLQEGSIWINQVMEAVSGVSAPTKL